MREVCTCTAQRVRATPSLHSDIEAEDVIQDSAEDDIQNIIGILGNCLRDSKNNPSYLSVNLNLIEKLKLIGF